MPIRTDAPPPPLPANVLNLSVSQRSWNGVRLSVAKFQCAGEVVHRLPGADDACLSVVLEEVGGPCEPRLRADQRCAIDHMPRHMHFAPAGLGMWGYTRAARQVVDATLAFDFARLDERLGTRFDSAVMTTPQARFANERIWTLVKLLSAVVHDPDPSTQLYGDGITAAIAAQLFAAPDTAAARAGALAPWQLRRVVDYMEAHLPRRVELATLAALLDLSQAHFSRAFKASTGLAPYRWQLAARIRRAQALLALSNASLYQVAEATGFADAVHFGRTFRKLTGTTPAAWRHERRGDHPRPLP